MIECWYVKYIFNCAQNSINSWVSKYNVDNIKVAVKIKLPLFRVEHFFLVRFMNVKLFFSADQAFEKCFIINEKTQFLLLNIIY